MRGKEYEIVERSSGYWITNGEGNPDGPYDSIEEAMIDVPTDGQLQYPLPMGNKRLKFGGTQMSKYRAITIPSETVGKLLDAIYEQYPEGASSMPDKLEEAVTNTLYELDELKV